MVKVWDGFVRLSHWLIALGVLSAWVSANYGDVEYRWHTWNGYAILVLVTSRLIWALVGSSTARFSEFLSNPLSAFAYLKRVARKQDEPYLGHNPAGGWMALILWLLLLAQGGAGLFSSDDILVEGPLTYLVSGSTVSTLTAWHHRIFNVILLCIGLHLLAVAYHQWVKKEKLVQAMFSGVKPIVESNQSFQPTKKANYFRSFSLAVAVVLVVFVLYALLLRYLIS